MNKFIILNIVSYESRHDDNEYVNRLAFIKYFIADNCCTIIYVTERDMNADISDNASSFAKNMIRMCEDHNLVLSSQVLLPGLII